MSLQKRVRVVISGLVQGVFFRDSTRRRAEALGVTGWVRNVGYDTVEAVAEGDRAKVERFIEMMIEGPRASRVDESRIEWEMSTGEFREFGVKRSF